MPETSYTGAMQVGGPNQGGNIGRVLRLTPHLPHLADGLQQVRLTMQATISESWQDPVRSVATKTITLTRPFLLTPKDQPTVQIRRDEALRAGVEKALSVILSSAQFPPRVHIRDRERH